MLESLTTSCPILRRGAILHRRGVSGVPGLHLHVKAVEVARDGFAVVTDALGRRHRLYTQESRAIGPRFEFLDNGEAWYVDRHDAAAGLAGTGGEA